MLTFVIVAWVIGMGQMVDVSSSMQWWLFALMVLESTTEIVFLVRARGEA